MEQFKLGKSWASILLLSGQNLVGHFASQVSNISVFSGFGMLICLITKPVRSWDNSDLSNLLRFNLLSTFIFGSPLG